ncbi:MAG: electron transport complex subunit RsxG [Cellvibrionaceae bacterium]
MSVTIGSAISRNSIILGLFALAMAGVLGITAESTKDKIAAAEKAAATRALLEIIPLERHSNDLLVDVLPAPEAYWPSLGLKQGGNIHIARDKNNTPIAVIVPAVAPDGYSGDIKLIAGINMDGTLAGVRVLTHAETPGLGDKVELKKSNWILSFNDKSLSNPSEENWAVKKDKGEFDQFTGATITPRAVVNQVYRVLKYFEQDKAQLLKAAGTDTISQSEPKE